MAQAIPSQHPAVVLRSHYVHLRALLAVLLVAVVGLAAAVMVLATQDEVETGAGFATQSAAPAVTADPPGSIRFDGGPEEGTRGATVPPPSGIRYDGGPEEGGHGTVTSQAASGIRYDGGPEEGSIGR